MFVVSVKFLLLYWIWLELCRSRRPCILRRRSTATHLLRSWVRIPPGAWMFVGCVLWVLSGRGLCDGLIACPEESYWLARHCVWSRNLMIRGGQTLRWAAVPEKIIIIRIVWVWDGLGLAIYCQNVRCFSAGVLTGVLRFLICHFYMCSSG
jgi:hypothetical protein